MIRSFSARSLIRAASRRTSFLAVPITPVFTRSAAVRHVNASARAPNAALATAVPPDITGVFDPLVLVRNSFVSEQSTVALPDDRDEFRRHRYLLHLVPVTNRYLAARRQGILSKVPTLLHPPTWDYTMSPRHEYAPMSYDHARQPIEGTDSSARLDGVLHWMEDLYLHGTTRVEAVLSPAHHHHGEGNVDILAYTNDSDSSAMLWRVGADGVVELVPDADVNEEEEGLYVPHINTAFWDLGGALLEAYKFCATRRGPLRGWDGNWSHLLSIMHLTEDETMLHPDGRTHLPTVDNTSMPPSEFGDYLHLATNEVSLPVWRHLTIDENPHHLRESAYPDQDVEARDEHSLRTLQHERACDMYSVVLGWEDVFDPTSSSSFARVVDRLSASDVQEHATLMKRLKKSYIDAYAAAANYL